MAKVLINEENLTNVANAIREKTGKTDLITPSNFDTEISTIESASEYVSNVITSGWKNTIKKLPTPLRIQVNGNYYNTFEGYPFSDSIPDMIIECTSLAGLFKNAPFTICDFANIDTSKVTSMMEMFGGSQVTEIRNLDTSALKDARGMFGWTSKIVHIDKLDFSKVTMLEVNGGDSYDFFTQNTQSNIYVGGFENLGAAYLTSTAANYLPYTLQFSQSYYQFREVDFTEESLINILTNLYDIATKGCNTQSVIIGSANIAKLTSEEGQAALAQAQNYGWTIS